MPFDENLKNSPPPRTTCIFFNMRFLLDITTCTVPGSSCIIVLSLGHNKSLDNALWLVVAVCSYLNLGPQAKKLPLRWTICSRICTSQVGKQEEEEEHNWWWWERMVRPTSSTNGWWVMSSPPGGFFLNFFFCMQVTRRRRRGGRRVVGCNYFCLSLRVAWMKIQICNNDTCIFCFSFGFCFRRKVSFLSLYILHRIILWFMNFHFYCSWKNDEPDFQGSRKISIFLYVL